MYKRTVFGCEAAEEPLPADTNDVRREGLIEVSLDAIDRKLLAALQADATRTYANLAGELHLSAPALHERVKRLKARKVIRRTTVELDPRSLGRMLCAFVHVDAEGGACARIADALAEDGRVEEIHSVAGGTCMVIKVRAGMPEELESLLESIHTQTGARRVESFVVLRTYLDRGPDPQC